MIKKYNATGLTSLKNSIDIRKGLLLWHKFITVNQI